MRKIELIIGKIYTGEEVNEIEQQNANFDITRECIFKLVKMNKRNLYDKNLITKEEWMMNDDNYDGWHTNQIDWMIEVIRDKSVLLPPIVVDMDGMLQDGTHRLGAYNEIDEIEEILVFKEVSNE